MIFIFSGKLLEEFYGKVDFSFLREYSSGTKGERILHADDMDIALQGFASLIKTMGKDGHKIVGQATSIEGVEKILKKGLRPTVAFIDNSFPNKGDGEKAAALVREISPETIIVSLSGDENVRWGDHNLLKLLSRDQLADFLLNLQH